MAVPVLLNVLASTSDKLKSLEIDIACTPTQLHALSTPLFSALRLRRLFVRDAPGDGWQRAAGGPPGAYDAVSQLADDLGKHATVTELGLRRAPLRAGAFPRLVAASLANRLSCAIFVECALRPEAAPSLTALFGAGSLETLHVLNAQEELLDAATVGPFAAAIRSSRSLKHCVLAMCRLWEDPVVGNAVVEAFVGHRTVRGLSFLGNPIVPADRVAAGGALARLVAPPPPQAPHAQDGGAALAPPPPLQPQPLASLNVSVCFLGDDGLRLLLHALPSNSTLRALRFSGSAVSGAFARSVLLPSIVANVGLRELQAGLDPNIPEMAQSEAVVAARGAGV